MDDPDRGHVRAGEPRELDVTRRVRAEVWAADSELSFTEARGREHGLAAEARIDLSEARVGPLEVQASEALVRRGGVRWLGEVLEHEFVMGAIRRAASR